MKRILPVIICFFSMPLMASHIVGGEFEIVHVTGNQYRVSLILYFDELNGNPGAKDNNFTTAIYRKRDNFLMQNVFFSSYSITNVDYTQPECSNGEIVTSKLVYTTTLQLSDDRFNDPEGYYIVWERCCRNYTITNIYSDNPLVGSRSTGQTFYLEFPPVVKNGQPFINSSPRLFPPLNDYACPRKPYYVDFAGIDDDGDSLAYSLVTPLGTHSEDPFPPLLPGPYPLVDWKPPFSLSNILGGAPDLKISDDGFLTATPTQQGLYVFAVRCAEFRDGVKIGEVRRDFQMLVVDVCPQAEPPRIVGKKLTDAAFTYDETMAVTFSNTVADGDRCIEVQVSDPDASKADDNFLEKVKIKAIPIGFKKDVRGILPDITSATLVNGSTKNFQICFDKCPYINGPFQVGIVAYDDACSLPLFDTLKVTVNIQPPANTNAYFTTPDVEEQLNEGTKKTWPIAGMDDDGDQLILGVIVNGFKAEDVGMKVVQVKNENGQYEGYLEWDTRCDVYDFSKKTEFDVQLLLEDVDECSVSRPDIMTFKLRVKLPGNGDPVIDSNLTDNPFERTVDGLKRKVNESLTFNVTGKDADLDYLVLGVKGVGFNIQDYDVSFPTATGNGTILSPFKWNIFCDNVDLEQKDEFTFQFIVVDNANKCRLYKADTLDVTVKLYPPDNNSPDLLIASLNPAVQMINNDISIELGQQITLGLSGVDPDVAPQADWLRLNLIDITGTAEPEGYIFAPAEGRGTVSTTFTWKPECSLFGNITDANADYEDTFTFTFNVIDDRCFSQKGDTVAIDITVKDVDRDDDDFMPPNIITPNGDRLNDFFAMVKMDENTGDLVNILPRDNCTGHFEGITIYNRWGRQVYKSTDRDFKWYADGESAGEYYYLIKYSDREYKGIISVAFFDSQSVK
jgi:hypothetical protein